MKIYRRVVNEGTETFCPQGGSNGPKMIPTGARSRGEPLHYVREANQDHVGPHVCLLDFSFCFILLLFFKSESKFYVYAILIITHDSGFITTLTRLIKNVESVSGAIRPFHRSIQIHINTSLLVFYSHPAFQQLVLTLISLIDVRFRAQSSVWIHNISWKLNYCCSLRNDSQFWLSQTRWLWNFSKKSHVKIFRLQSFNIIM